MKRLFLLIYLLGTTSIVYSQHATFNPTPYKESFDSWLDFIGTGDLNGDGLIDVVGATTYYFAPTHDHKIFVWLQNNKGKLEKPLLFPYIYPPGRALSFRVENLFADANDQIIMSTGAYTLIYSLRNNNMVLEDSVRLFQNDPQTGIAVGDFDEDGLKDVAISYSRQDKIAILYQNIDPNKRWDTVVYTLPNNTFGGFMRAGKFGSITHTSIISINGAIDKPMSVITFDKNRQLQTVYAMELPPKTSPHSRTPSALTIVNTGKDNNGQAKNEIWVIYGGNWPNSKVAVWRDIQKLPDTIFVVDDRPETIHATNLDCDDDDEVVILHGGKVAVYSNKKDTYALSSPSHYEPDGLAFGDVDNDGRIDLCIANGSSINDLIIFYNITSRCWPSFVETNINDNEPIKIFPNPANHRITIEYPDSGNLKISTIEGRVIYSSPFSNSTSIKTLDWSAGVYYIQLQIEKGTTLTGKLFIN